MQRMKAPVVCMFLGSLAVADFPIAIPPSPLPAGIATIYGVGIDSTSSNALEIKRLTGATYYAGIASSASLTETTDSGLALRYSLVYSPNDRPYRTNAGIRLPIVPDGWAKNLSKVEAIEFDIKAATPGCRVQLRIGSGLYPEEAVDSGVELGSNAIELTTEYKTVSVSTPDMFVPIWYPDTRKDSLGWTPMFLHGDVITTYPVKLAIAPAVASLKFGLQLDGIWNTDGTGFKATSNASATISNTFTIRNVVLVGWGFDSSNVSVVRPIRSNGALLASYRSGLLLSYAVTGPSALVEVRNLSGMRLASFLKDAKVRNLSLPLNLARGTYVVSVQGTGARQTALLNVAR